MESRSSQKVPADILFEARVHGTGDLALAAVLKNCLLFVEQRLPVCRHRSGRSGRRLIQWMTVRSVKLRAGDELLRTIVIEPMLARLKARDYRVTRGSVMLRCMLIW
jgi:hypothetical protein